MARRRMRQVMHKDMRRCLILVCRPYCVLPLLDKHQHKEWWQDTTRHNTPKTNTFPIAHCTNYLCPGTLACVSFPHHCPCAFPEVEDKVELGEGIAICASKGGYKVGEMARKVELARKGLL
jgi:hypothetical protein